MDTIQEVAGANPAPRSKELGFKMLQQTGIESWTRQPNESPPAFQAFVVYRDLGLGMRSNAKVSRELGKSVTLMNRWSSRWDWVKRVARYDEDIDKQIRERHIKELYEARDRHANLSRLLQTKFLERLRDLSVQDIPVVALANILKVATDVELRALGEATIKTEQEITGADGGAFRISIDELAKLAEQNGYIEQDPTGNSLTEFAES